MVNPLKATRALAPGGSFICPNTNVAFDSASSDMELKGGQISLKATNGVTVDGGGGAVSVSSNAALSLTGSTAKLEGKASTEVKGGAMCSVSAAMVKIN